MVYIIHGTSLCYRGIKVLSDGNKPGYIKSVCVCTKWRERVKIGRYFWIRHNFRVIKD